MIKAKKIIMIVISCVMMAIMSFSFIACGEGESDSDLPTSTLYGTFTYNSTLGDTNTNKLKLTNDKSLINENSFLLYCDPAYVPFNNAGGDGAIFSYQISQRLALSRTFTYVYTYSVVIKNPNQWGATLGKMQTEVSGTFEFTALSGSKYNVRLSAPSSGKQEVYGIKSNAGAINTYWNWSISDTPTYSQNFDYSDCFNSYDYTFIGNVRAEDGSLTGERDIVVDTEGSLLDDNIFYPELYSLFALYGKY